MVDLISYAGADYTDVGTTIYRNHLYRHIKSKPHAYSYRSELRDLERYQRLSRLPHVHHAGRWPTMREIIKLVPRRYGLFPQEILAYGRSTRLVWPRQVAMYAGYALTGLNLSQIAMILDRDRTTVAHGVDQVLSAVEIDPNRAQEIQQVERFLMEGCR